SAGGGPTAKGIRWSSGRRLVQPLANPTRSNSPSIRPVADASRAGGARLLRLFLDPNHEREVSVVTRACWPRIPQRHPKQVHGVSLGLALPAAGDRFE